MVDWNCNICKKYQSGTACTYCDDGSEFERMSQGDKIRSMNDEELAEFLATLTICELCEYCGENKCNRTGGDYLCTSAMAAKTMCKWLKSEVKEEN